MAAMAMIILMRAMTISSGEADEPACRACTCGRAAAREAPQILPEARRAITRIDAFVRSKF